MQEREHLTTTFGILLAGLIQAEEQAAPSTRRPPVRTESGVFPAGEVVAAPEPEPLEPAAP